MVWVATRNPNALLDGVGIYWKPPWVSLCFRVLVKCWTSGAITVPSKAISGMSVCASASSANSLHFMLRYFLYFRKLLCIMRIAITRTSHHRKQVRENHYTSDQLQTRGQNCLNKLTFLQKNLRILFFKRERGLRFSSCHWEFCCSSRLRG